MSIEQLRFQAQQRGDTKEAERLGRLMQRLDDQRQAYGKSQR